MVLSRRDASTCANRSQTAPWRRRLASAPARRRGAPTGAGLGSASSPRRAPRSPAAGRPGRPRCTRRRGSTAAPEGCTSRTGVRRVTPLVRTGCVHAHRPSATAVRRRSIRVRSFVKWTARTGVTPGTISGLVNGAERFATVTEKVLGRSQAAGVGRGHADRGRGVGQGGECDAGRGCEHRHRARGGAGDGTRSGSSANQLPTHRNPSFGSWQAVRRNGGASGVDGETVADMQAQGWTGGWENWRGT